MNMCHGGTLVDVMREYPEDKLPEPFVLAVLARVNVAVTTLHKTLGKAHLDLKPCNFFLKRKLPPTPQLLPEHARHVVLGDFGSCLELAYPEGSVRRDSRLRSTLAQLVQARTTPSFRPPELADLFCGSVIDTRTDYWSLGCALYKLMYFHAPFGDETTDLAVASGKWAFPAELSRALEMGVDPLTAENEARQSGIAFDSRRGPTYSDGLKQIVTRLIDRDPKTRLDSAGVVDAVRSMGLEVSTPHIKPAPTPDPAAVPTSKNTHQRKQSARSPRDQLDWFSASQPSSPTVTSAAPSECEAGTHFIAAPSVQMSDNSDLISYMFEPATGMVSPVESTGRGCASPDPFEAIAGIRQSHTVHPSLAPHTERPLSAISIKKVPVAAPALATLIETPAADEEPDAFTPENEVDVHFLAPGAAEAEIAAAVLADNTLSLGTLAPFISSMNVAAFLDELREHPFPPLSEPDAALRLAVPLFVLNQHGVAPVVARRFLASLPRPRAGYMGKLCELLRERLTIVAASPFCDLAAAHALSVALEGAGRQLSARAAEHLKALGRPPAANPLTPKFFGSLARQAARANALLNLQLQGPRSPGASPLPSPPPESSTHADSVAVLCEIRTVLASAAMIFGAVRREDLSGAAVTLQVVVQRLEIEYDKFRQHYAKLIHRLPPGELGLVGLPNDLPRKWRDFPACSPPGERRPAFPGLRRASKDAR
eukprot:gnl/Chilomastix_cuspidata/1856.p1 GENE.gnl/Chilomastix_cuspidata/1856~~gnl/Chilomastix_cuspidata/1856.p1  ORF type:complete len:823 (+),score=229.23 gnl/Chilomastix_cuspidata/1856:339-2471(+)